MRHKKNYLMIFLLLICHVAFSVNGQISDKTVLDISGQEYDYIESYAFFRCYNVKTVSFSDSLISIGEGAFEECYNLENVVLPDGCEEIDDQAFFRCVSLKTIEIPPSVIYFGENIFPLDILMVVKQGSEAEKYAKKNNLDYVYTGKQTDAQNVIGPILKTNWNQPTNYFYSENKFGTESNGDGLCESIAWGQVLNHLKLNIYGSRRYSTMSTTYYKDFDIDPVQINKLPLYLNLKPLSFDYVDQDSKDEVQQYLKDSISNNELYKYIENIAFALRHGWKNEKLKNNDNNITINQHVPIYVKYYPISNKNKTDAETIIRNNLEKNIPLVAILGKKNDRDHAVVIDGIRKKDGKQEVHINFGWGGSQNRWCELCTPIKLVYPQKFKEKRGIFDLGIVGFYEVTPIVGEELKKWTPYRVK